MADRLRVLGVGNGMPILFDPNTSGEDYPLTLTKAQIIEWYWLVKNWTLSTDFAAISNGTSLTLDSALVPDGSNPTRERDLILFPGAKIFGVPGTSAGAGSTINVSSVTLFNITPAMYRQPNATDYLPFFTIIGTIAADDGAGNVAQLPFSSRAADIVGATGSITANVYGKTLPLYYREDIVGAGASFVHTTFDLDPIEWWAYAAEDTSPIYDTATGAQLQSPLN